MAATAGSAEDPASEINLSPMIEILLVLLVTFMVIVLAIPGGEAASMPRSSPERAMARPQISHSAGVDQIGLMTSAVAGRQ